MASVLNRTTRQFIQSANTPDYSVDDWIINPDMSAVAGVAQKYWVIAGDAVSEMGQSAKDVVTAAEAQAMEDGEIAEADSGFLRRFALILIDELNTLRAEHGLPARNITQLKAAMRTK